MATQEYYRPIETENDIYKRVDGDGAFLGVMDKIRPEMLPEGYLAAAGNVRLDSGAATTRAGVFCPNCFNLGISDTIIGAGVYADPDDGGEWLVVACEASSYLCRDGMAPQALAYPDGMTLSGEATLLQTFNSMLLLRATGDPLQWDGDPNVGWSAVTQSSSGDGTETIPNSLIATVFANRTFIASARDTVAVSDILDFTRYDSTMNAFRVNDGTSDQLTAIHPWSQDYILAFKDASTWVIENVKGDLNETSLYIVSSSIGCVARKTVATVGGDVLFLSRHGVHRVNQNIETQISVPAIPVSDNIAATIDRINWDAAGGAAAAVFGERYWLAVPLDDSTTNNALLVYNIVNSQWEGIDTWDSAAGVRIDRFAVARYLGAPRLVGVGAKVYVMDEYLGGDAVGTAASDIHAITTTVTTRSYAANSVRSKHWHRPELVVRNWGEPSITIESAEDGYNETQTVASLTRDRTLYHTWATPAWDATNAADDWDTPRRQDYSVVPGLTVPGDINPETWTETTERFAMRLRSRTCQFSLTSTSGAMALSQAMLTGRKGEVTRKTDA